MAKNNKHLSIVCPYYLDIVDNWAPFTKEEELEFRDKMLAEGNIKRLKDELVLRNVGILNTFGKRWLYIYSPEDTVSIGITALYEAVNKFDFSRRDVKFTSYAQWYITRIYSRSKDKYYNEVDENSVSWDKPVLTNEDDGSACLGDFIQDLILPEAKVINDNPWQIKNENVLDVIRNIIATKVTKNNIIHVNTFLFMLSHPELTPKKAAEEMAKAGLEIDGLIKTRERIHQRFVKGRNLFLDALRKVALSRITKLNKKPEEKERPIEEQYDEKDLKSYNKLVWNCKTKRYDVETVKFPRFGAKPKFPLLTTNLDHEIDKLLQDLFGVKFFHGQPDHCCSVVKRSTTSKWYEQLKENA